MSSKNCFKARQLLWYAWLFLLLDDVECCQTQSSSETCKQLQQISLSLDEDVNPCDDFYAYACNNWAMQHLVSEYETITEWTEYKMNLNLIALLDSLYEQKDSRYFPNLVSKNQSIFQKTMIYYKSCVTESSHSILHFFEIIKPGKNLEWPLIEYMKAYAKGEREWPLWNADSFDILSLLGRLQSYGLNNVLLQHYFLRASNGILYIWLRKPERRLKDTVASGYLKDLLINAGLSEQDVVKFVQHMIDSHQFWLTKYSLEVDTDPIELSYLEMKQEYPRLTVFLENMLPHQIQNNDRITLDNLLYIQYIVNYEWSYNEKLSICNYLMLKFMGHLLNDFVTDHSKLECMKVVRLKFDVPLNLLYYEYIMQAEEASKKLNYDIFALFNKTRHYLTKTLEENRLFLSQSELHQLEHSLTQLSLNIGNFPLRLHPSQIEEFYRNIPALELHKFAYYANHLHLLQHRFHKSLLRRGNQTNYIYTDYRTGLHSSPFYSGELEMIILPLAALQAPVYHPSYAGIFKWSLMGFLLAQALTLVIPPYPDNLKLSYSSDFRNCMHKQELAEIDDVEILSYLVAGRVAYEAYSNEQKTQLQPDFTTTSWQKLFFLNLAQYFCTSSQDGWSHYYHNPNHLRKMVMNLEEFAEAFQCPLGSGMNPATKCRFY